MFRPCTKRAIADWAIYRAASSWVELLVVCDGTHAVSSQSASHFQRVADDSECTGLGSTLVDMLSVTSDDGYLQMVDARNGRVTSEQFLEPLLFTHEWWGGPGSRVALVGYGDGYLQLADLRRPAPLYVGVAARCDSRGHRSGCLSISRPRFPDPALHAVGEIVQATVDDGRVVAATLGSAR